MKQIITENVKTAKRQKENHDEDDSNDEDYGTYVPSSSSSGSSTPQPSDALWLYLVGRVREGITLPEDAKKVSQLTFLLQRSVLITAAFSRLSAI